MHRPFVALLPQFQVHLIRVSSSENEATRAAAQCRKAEKPEIGRMRMAPRLLGCSNLGQETAHNTDVGVAYCNPAANSEPTRAELTD